MDGNGKSVDGGSQRPICKVLLVTRCVLAEYFPLQSTCSDLEKSVDTVCPEKWRQHALIKNHVGTVIPLMPGCRLVGPTGIFYQPSGDGHDKVSIRTRASITIRLDDPRPDKAPINMIFISEKRQPSPSGGEPTKSTTYPSFYSPGKIRRWKEFVIRAS